jgi:hypothetical protein
MSSKLSVEDVLSQLEKRAAFHREQEALHREELEKVLQSLEAFRTVAANAVDLADLAQPAAAKSVSREEELPPPGRLQISRLLRSVILSPSLAEPFGASVVATEANRRIRDRLSPVDRRTASDVLRRMLAEGAIRLAREGKAFHEALYTRSPRR